MCTALLLSLCLRGAPLADLPASPVHLTREDAPLGGGASLLVSMSGTALGFALIGTSSMGRPNDALGTVSSVAQLLAGFLLASYGPGFGDLLNDARARFLFSGTSRAALGLISLAAAVMPTTPASRGAFVATASIGLTIWAVWAFIEAIDARRAPDRWVARMREELAQSQPPARVSPSLPWAPGPL